MTNNTLFVSGSASNQTKPDKVTVSLGVETTNSTAQAALTSNSNLMNKVLESLKAEGFKKMKQVLPLLTSLQIIIIHLTTIKED